MMRMETGKNRKKTGNKPEENRKKTGSIFSGKGGENVLKMGDAGKKRTGGQASDPRANEKKNRAAFAAGPANPAANTARSSAETSGFSTKAARFRTSGAFGVFGTFGAKCGAAVVALALAFFTALSLVTPALAATLSGLSTEGDMKYLQVTTNDSTGTWTADGTTITGNVPGHKKGWSINQYNESKLTITNTSTTSTGQLMFSYTAKLAVGVKGLAGATGAAGKVTVGTSTAERDDFTRNNPIVLPPTGTITVTIRSGEATTRNDSKETTITLSNIEFELEKTEAEVTVNAPVRGGTVKVDGTALTETQKQVRNSGSTVSLAAEPENGYRFYGWYSVSDGQYTLLSENAAYSYEVPKYPVEIQAVFVEKDISPIFSVNGTDYYDFSVAMSASNAANAPAVLKRDYTLPAGEYTIPAAATLLLPYADGQTTINGQSETLSFANATKFDGSITDAMLDIAYQRNKTLTIPAGVTIKNYGKIVVGGTIASTGGGYGGVCAGAHSNIQLDGTIEMTGANCILSAVGYIVGNGQIVTFEGTGAQLYQPFTICDYRGGGYTVTAAGNSFAGAKVETNESLISPFIRYTARSIQVQTVIAYGSTMTGYCDLYANDDHNMTKTLLIGSGGLINLGAGSKAVCSYDANTYVAPYPAIGKTTIAISGGGSFGYLTLGVKVPILGTQEIKTNALIFPVPYNFDIQLNKGSYTIGYPVALLPGAGLYVAEDASLNVGSSASDFRFLVLDGLYDHTKGATETGPATVTYGTQPGLNYPTTGLLKANTFGGTGTADLVVAGTLNIQKGVNFGGVVQAGDTGVLNMDAAAKNSASMQIGLEGKHSILTKTYYLAGATTRTLNAQIIDTGTGQRLNILPGLTYHAGSGADILQNYTYHLYTTSADTSKKETHTEDLNAAISGGWYSQMVTVHTVDSSGNELGTYQQGFAQGADISAFYTDKALTAKAATVTAETTNLYALAVASVRHEGTLTYYGLLGQAIKAAQQGDTVALLSNLTVDKPTAIAEDQSFTMDLAGNTLFGSSTLLVNNGTLTLELNGGELSVVSTKPDNTALIGAIENAGTLSVVDSSTDQSGAIRCANSREFTINYASTAAIAQQGEASYNQSRTSTVSSRLDQLCGIVNNGTIKAISAGTVHGAYYGIYNTGTIETMGGSAVVTSDYTALQNNGTVRMISGGKLESTGKAFFIPTSWATCRGDVVKNSGMIGEITGNAEIGASAGSSMTFYSYQAAGKNYTHYLAPGAGLANDSGKTITMIGKSTISSESYYGLYNVNGGKITTIGAATISSGNNYALFNSGGTITTIDGTTITGAYGIWNRNIRKATPADGTQWTNSYSGTIGTIKDAVVEAKWNYALRNAGTIQKISGATEMRCTSTATDRYVVYNENGFYQDSSISKRTDTTDNDNKKYTRVDECNAPYPTIGLITDRVQISSEKGRGIYSAGKITTINGSVAISAQNRALYVEGGGVVDTISGNAAISTTADYAVQVSGARAVKNEYEYADKVGGNVINQVTTYSDPSRIGTITGNVKISAGTNYGIENRGTIDEISNGVTITAKNYAINNSASIPVSRKTTAATTKAVTESGSANPYYDTKREYLYEYGKMSTIGTISNSVTITATGTTALRNYGKIDTLQNVKLSAASDVIYNQGEGTQTGNLARVWYAHGSSEYAVTTQYFNESDISGRQYAQPEINTIEGCTITSTGSGAIAIKNAGKIGTISDNTVTATGVAISNTERARGASTQIATVSGSDGAWTVTPATGRVDAYSALPEIGTIGANTITSTSGNAIDNRGIITTLGADGLSVTANAGHAVYSADSLKLDSYKTKSQPYAGQSCTVVTEIKKNDGTIITPAEIQALTTGQYSAGGNGTYALYNNGSKAIPVTAEALSPYSGPEFKSASGTRPYAVYGPDNAAKQTYVSNGDQGTPVTLSAKADGDGWFYLVANTATVVFDGGENSTNTSDAKLLSQLVDLSDTSATITCPVFKKDGHKFLGFAKTQDAKTAEFSIGDAAALQIPVSQLGAKTGDTVTLYAVYEAEFRTVTWNVTGVTGVTFAEGANPTKVDPTVSTLTKTVTELFGDKARYLINKCTVTGEGTTATHTTDSVTLDKITSDITVTLELVAYDHIVTVKDTSGSSETYYVAKDLDVLTGKSIGYTVNGRKLITEATGNACNINVSDAKTKVEVTNITADTTVTVTLVDYQYKVVVQNAGGAVLQTQYVSVSGENVTDVLDNSKPVGYKVTGQQLIKGVTEANCKATISEDKTAVTVTSINGDATVTVTLVAYDHIVTVNATGYSQTYYVKNNGNVLANNAPITYKATGQNVISGVTVSPNGKATASHTATTATITDITGSVIVTVALESYDHLVTIKAGGSSETHYVKGDKDVLTNAAITYTAGENQVITGITGGGATFKRGEGDVNAEVADGWKSFTLSGIKKDQTVAVTLKDYAHTVDWTRVEDNKGSVITTTRREYVAEDESATLKLSEGFRATGVTGADSATVDTSQNGVVTISGIKENLQVTVTARNYSYAVTWKVSGTGGTTESKTYLEFGKTTATYTAGASAVIISASVDSGNAAQVTHTNTTVTVTGIISDVTVHVTTEAPTTDKATYYFGDMSYEYKRNTVLYQWDGKSEDKGQWIPVDSFAWQHKAGSRIYEFEDENLEAIVVPNGSVLLVNGSNQTMQYTVTYTPDGELTNAVMTFTAGEETGKNNTLSVVLKPGKQAMVSSTFACDVSDQKLTNAAAGQVTVTTEPYNN